MKFVERIRRYSLVARAEEKLKVLLLRKSFKTHLEATNKPLKNFAMKDLEFFLQMGMISGEEFKVARQEQSAIFKERTDIAWETKREKAEKAKQAALKAWETKREKAEMVETATVPTEKDKSEKASQAAFKAWETKRAKAKKAGYALKKSKVNTRYTKETKSAAVTA